MSTQRSASAAGVAPQKSYFDQQREALIGEIAMACLSSLPAVCVSHVASRRFPPASPTNSSVLPLPELRASPCEYQQAEPVARGCDHGELFFYTYL